MKLVFFLTTNLAWRRIFCSKIAIFPQFQVYLSIKAKQIIYYFSTISIQWHHTDEFEKKTTNLCIRCWSLVMVRNRLPAQVVNLWNDVSRTSRIFCLKIAIFSKFQVYLSTTQAKQIINLLLLNNFYPVISYQRLQKEKKATKYCTRFGHSLWSANQLPAQGVETNDLNGALTIHVWT